jgi:polyisoprenyl-phosphate glycosyltransferase
MSKPPRTDPPDFSLVVPCFNEAAGIAEFHRRAGAVADRIGGRWEIVYVNDGSRDETLLCLERLRASDGRVAIINLSRNFGKEIALTAGLDHAAGLAVIVIDADLQDPPEVITELVSVWREGYDMVYAQRRRREGETWLKKTTADGFYRVMQRVGGVSLPRDTGDFRLISRRALEATAAIARTASLHEGAVRLGRLSEQGGGL